MIIPLIAMLTRLRYAQSLLSEGYKASSQTSTGIDGREQLKYLDNQSLTGSNFELG